MYCFANWLEERKADTVLLRVIPSLEGQTVLSLVNEMELLLILMGTIVLCLEVAFRLGLRMRVRTDEANRAHVNALQAALLGLLALLLGFTFAMAVSRFDTRKSLVLAEANAIGTVGLRASLLPPGLSDCRSSATCGTMSMRVSCSTMRALTRSGSTHRYRGQQKFRISCGQSQLLQQPGNPTQYRSDSCCNR